jgi:hypothetical protein
MTTIKVKAKEGTRCPMENNPRKFIPDSAAIEVPDSSYFRRLVRDGSLVVVEEKEKDNKQPGVSKASKEPVDAGEDNGAGASDPEKSETPAATGGAKAKKREGK